MCLTVYNYQPEHITAEAYNLIATEFGWGGCDKPPCVDFVTPDASAANQLAYLDGVDTNAYIKDKAYFKPVLALFAMGMVLRAIAAFLLIYTKRPQQVKPSPPPSIIHPSFSSPLPFSQVKPTLFTMIMGEKTEDIIQDAGAGFAVFLSFSTFSFDCAATYHPALCSNANYPHPLPQPHSQPLYGCQQSVGEEQQPALAHRRYTSNQRFQHPRI